MYLCCCYCYVWKQTNWYSLGRMDAQIWLREWIRVSWSLFLPWFWSKTSSNRLKDRKKEPFFPALPSLFLLYIHNNYSPFLSFLESTHVPSSPFYYIHTQLLQLFSLPLPLDVCVLVHKVHLLLFWLLTAPRLPFSLVCFVSQRNATKCQVESRKVL